MLDIKEIKSHPDKELSVHLNGVRTNVSQLAGSRKAELAAIWHDLGKCNPNFQAKIAGDQVSGYDKHSYLSAFALFCAIGCCKKVKSKAFEQFFDVSKLTSNEIIALITIVAKHHGNLPDFMPTGNRTILNSDELTDLYSFLDANSIQLNEVLANVMEMPDYNEFIANSCVRKSFRDRFAFRENDFKGALNFFCETQKTFATLILSDKLDAAGVNSLLEDDKKVIEDFSKYFHERLDCFLSSLCSNTKLNELRTVIRRNAVEKITSELVQSDKHIFELTSPTGSGKTLMLLSLASEIVKQKGGKRIIYALPFLSITEQVENVVHEIFKDRGSDIRRIDSKADNSLYDKLIEETESEQTEDTEKIRTLIDFKEQTFAFPFIITTFVRFFETLMSNTNRELLKLPNFSNCIFLLDEIQTLPPRLYGFFVAYLEKFCKENNSYAIVSTATQPKFDLPENNEVKDFFESYEKPSSLLLMDYFNNELFNRYVVHYRKDGIEAVVLAEEIINCEDSVLVILNTIDDTKQLYDTLLEMCDSSVKLVLLNTHFTTEDRKKKIANINTYLKDKQRVIVISTQLVEAGVDIDFPIVYRDMTIVSSIVQSAGRCNRNGKMATPGDVHLINLMKDGKSRSQLIYRGPDRELLKFTKEALTKDEYKETELLSVQNEFFRRIQSELNFGVYGKNRNFLKDIRQCMFEEIGNFSLIDKDDFGDIRQYYVPNSEDDNLFEELLRLSENINDSSSMDERLQAKRKLHNHLREMQNRIVQIRIKRNDVAPSLSCDKDYFGLYKLAIDEYSFEKGVNLSSSSIF